MATAPTRGIARVTSSSVSGHERYRLLGCLGRGGMAEVHLAKTVGPGGFERLVVVKRPLEHLRSDESYRRMFLDEARIVARIRHRNVVQVHDLCESDGDFWLVMEFLEGETAATFLTEARRFDPLIGAYIAYEAANGLHAAHEIEKNGRPCNLVHRDVSPQNLFVTYSGDVKLLDFGIARADDRETHTEHGVVKGNLPYMSPEQLTGEPLDRRSDLFSLGAVLFELATGIGLFHRKSPVDVIRSVCFADIPRPSDYRPDLPRGFDDICARALDRDPERRYRTAEEMARDLEELLSEVGGTTALRDGLADLMATHFDERRQQKRVLVDSDKRTERMAFDVAFPRAPAPAPALSMPEPAGSLTATVIRKERRPMRFAMLGALGFCVAIAGGIGLGFGWHAAAEHRVASASALVTELPVLQVEPLETPMPLRQETRTEPIASTVNVEVRSRPEGAVVTGPDGRTCTSPCAFSIARSEDAVWVSAASGQRTERARVVPLADRVVELDLSEEPARRAERPRSQRSTRAVAQRSTRAAPQRSERAAVPRSERRPTERSPFRPFD